MGRRTLCLGLCNDHWSVLWICYPLWRLLRLGTLPRRDCNDSVQCVTEIECLFSRGSQFLHQWCFDFSYCFSSTLVPGGQECRTNNEWSILPTLNRFSDHWSSDGWLSEQVKSLHWFNLTLTFNDSLKVRPLYPIGDWCFRGPIHQPWTHDHIDCKFS